ncbi:uncharacterized protein C8R40DRAFT_1105385 [Lentinula edodes]|uniref:uncharacterized protein n=1 Tax=Lentinula edodes TaxID=5353 RepID=UPI001E8D2747|nr:uncharacterized protein C8R40DRAFT_1105385 [Lentinula edodes]KAH7875206.1 hypothetical protein C8R40DRAFT_1105385 [Lentinula edodes]
MIISFLHVYLSSVFLLLSPFFPAPSIFSPNVTPHPSCLYSPSFLPYHSRLIFIVVFHTRFPLQIHMVLFPFELAVVFCYRSLTFSFDFPLFYYFNSTQISSIPFCLYHF